MLIMNFALLYNKIILFAKSFLLLLLLFTICYAVLSLIQLCMDLHNCCIDGDVACVPYYIKIKLINLGIKIIIIFKKILDTYLFYNCKMCL